VTPTGSRCSVRKDIVEEACHRHLVFLIGAHFRRVLRMRKAVRGAAIEVDLEVHLGGTELRDQTSVKLRRTSIERTPMLLFATWMLRLI